MTKMKKMTKRTYPVLLTSLFLASFFLSLNSPPAARRAFAADNIFTNNVGIGTTAPRQALDVINSAIVSGNIGVGTTAPSSALQVVGTVTATTFSGAGTSLTGTASSLTAGTVTTNANLSGAVTSSGNTTSLGSFSSSNLSGALTDEVGTGYAVFNGSPNFTGNIGIGTTQPRQALDVINNGIFSGNVGIGTTNPSYALDVSGDIRSTGNIYANNISPTGTSTFANLTVTGNTYLSTTTGNVGIATTTPGSKLQVNGNAAIGYAASTAVQANGLAVGGNIGIGTTNPRQVSDVVGSSIVSANIGIGTTAPVQKLHVEGQCVTGDTLLPILRQKLNPNFDIRNSDLDFVRIDKVKPGQYVLSLNEQTGSIEPHAIRGLLDMGIKPVFELTTASGRKIETTGNHPYLTKEGWKKVIEIEEGEDIAVSKAGLDRLTAMTLNVSSIMPMGVKHEKYPYTQHNNQRYNANHISHPLSIQSRSDNKKTNSSYSNREFQYQRSLKDKVADQKSYNEQFENIKERFSEFFFLFSIKLHQFNNYHVIRNLSRIFSEKKVYANMEFCDTFWDRVVSIKYLGNEQVYDIEVEGTHNFVAGHWVKGQGSRVKGQGSPFTLEPTPFTSEAFFGGIICHNTYINGNVGIGTTVPSSKLHVNSEISVGADDNNRGIINAGTAGLLTFGTIRASNNYFSTLAVYNGNVGIGTTGPVSKVDIKIGSLTTAGAFSSSALNIYHTTAVNDISQITFGYTPATYAHGYIGVIGTSALNIGYGDMIFGVKSVTTDTQPVEAMRIKAGGNVGIGVASPGHKLSIRNTTTGFTFPIGIGGGTHLSGSGVGISFDPEGYEGTGYVHSALVIAGAGYGYNRGDFHFLLNHAAADGVTTDLTHSRMTIKSDTGNVGIGFTNPASKLSIDGGLHVGGTTDAGDNNLLVDGTIYVGGTSTYLNANNLLIYYSGSEKIQLGMVGFGAKSWGVQVTDTGDGSNAFCVNAQAMGPLVLNGGLHVGGESDPGDNNLLVDGTSTLGTTAVNGTLSGSGAQIVSAKGWCAAVAAAAGSPYAHVIDAPGETPCSTLCTNNGWAGCLGSVDFNHGCDYATQSCTMYVGGGCGSTYSSRDYCCCTN